MHHMPGYNSLNCKSHVFRKNEVYRLHNRGGEGDGKSRGSLLGVSNLQLGGDAIQITTTLAGKSSATVGVLIHQLETLQSLQSFPGHGPGASAPVRRSGPVDLADSLHTDRGPDVHVPGHGSRPPC